MGFSLVVHRPINSHNGVFGDRTVVRKLWRDLIRSLGSRMSFARGGLTLRNVRRYLLLPIRLLVSPLGPLRHWVVPWVKFRSRRRRGVKVYSQECHWEDKREALIYIRQVDSPILVSLVAIRDLDLTPKRDTLDLSEDNRVDSLPLMSQMECEHS